MVQVAARPGDDPFMEIWFGDESRRAREAIREQLRKRKGAH